MENFLLIIPRFLVTVYIFLMMAVSFTFALIFQLIFLIVSIPFRNMSKKTQLLILGRIFRISCILGAFVFNPFWRLKVIRKVSKSFKNENTIIMCNHLSAADPWIVSAAIFPWEFKFILKASLLKIPIAGYADMLAGDIPVHFTKEKGGWGTEPGSVKSLMQSCRELIEMRIGLMVFPEGTRSKSGRLQPFKDGFFKFAIEEKCQILPCALHNSTALWPLHSKLLGCGTAYFAFGDAIIPDETTSVDKLRDDVRDAIGNLMKQFPLYDEERDKPLSSMASTRNNGFFKKKKKKKKREIGINYFPNTSEENLNK